MERRFIEVMINYKGKAIELYVTFDYYKGTTSAMGDDPTVMEPVEILDGTKTDLLNKLDDEYIDFIEDEIYNSCVN